METTCCPREFITLARATLRYYYSGKCNQESIFLHSERLPPERHGLGGELGEFGRQLGRMVEGTVVGIHVEPDEAWRPKPATNRFVARSLSSKVSDFSSDLELYDLYAIEHLHRRTYRGSKRKSISVDPPW